MHHPFFTAPAATKVSSGANAKPISTPTATSTRRARKCGVAEYCGNGKVAKGGPSLRSFFAAGVSGWKSQVLSPLTPPPLYCPTKSTQCHCTSAVHIVFELRGSKTRSNSTAPVVRTAHEMCDRQWARCCHWRQRAGLPSTTSWSFGCLGHLNMGNAYLPFDSEPIR